MTNPWLGALIAILGAILGAVGAKLIELSRPTRSRSVQIDTNYVRTGGEAYNEITALRTDQDAHFSMCTIYSAQRKHIYDKKITFSVLADHDYLGRPPLSEQGPFVCLDTSYPKSDCDIGIQVDGTNGVIHIRSMSPNHLCSILIACSYNHFVQFSSENDELIVTTFDKYAAVFGRKVLHRNYLVLILILTASLVLSSIFGFIHYGFF